MKRFAVAVIAALLFTSQQVEAAPKSIAASELTKVAPIAEHEGVAISNQGITIFSNVEKKVLVTSLDFLGAEKWTLAVEGATDQIAMAATSDKEGNIWLAGLTSAVGEYETQNATSSPVNVDGVVVEQVPALRSELNCLTLWKITSAGALIATYSESATAPLLITAISYSSSGISIIGDRGAGTVLITSTLGGKFTTAKAIGTPKSSFSSIFRNPDGSHYGFHQYYLLYAGEGWQHEKVQGGFEFADGRRQGLRRLDPRLQFDPRNKRLLGGQVGFTLPDGSQREFQVKVLGNTGFHLGAGLYHGLDGHYHGEWRGPLWVEGDYCADCSTPEAVARLKASTSLPIAVGFGVRTPDQAAAIATHADAVVVGSAIVDAIGAAAEERANDIPARVAAQVAALAQAVRTARTEKAA